MPSNERWRRSKIVEPPITTPATTPAVPIPSRDEEIIGGIKNALERGETLDSAKQSFINAGYKFEEVESAVQKVPHVASRISSPLPAQEPVMSKKERKKMEKMAKKSKVALGVVSAPAITQAPAPNPAQAANPLPATAPNSLPAAQSVAKKKAPIGFLIALIIMGVLIIGGGVYLGLNWDQFF